MPSLNAERTIEKALSSVRLQSINQKSIEILVIDGGSSDHTRLIAEESGAIVIDNPGVVPEAAKRIGLKHARGKYALWLDTDEELTSAKQLEQRLNLFHKDPRIRAILLDGYITPIGYSGLAEYINCFGDPFSYFIYRYDATNMIDCLKDHPNVGYDEGRMFFLGETDVIPIGDGGSTMFDLEYARRIFGEDYSTQDFAVTIFQSLVAQTGCLGIVPGDQIVHYATTTIRTFCNKLRFRAKTNVRNLEGYGFAAREKRNITIGRRKYFYLLYCLIFPWPVWDAIWMLIKKKNPAMLLHVFFTYYILFQVLWQYILKILNSKPGLSLYGK